MLFCALLVCVNVMSRLRLLSSSSCHVESMRSNEAMNNVTLVRAWETTNDVSKLDRGFSHSRQEL